MYASSSFVNPTPLAHADTPRDILPRGRVSQLNDDSSIIHTDSTDRTIIHTTTMNSIPQSDNQHLVKRGTSCYDHAAVVFVGKGRDVKGMEWDICVPAHLSLKHVVVEVAACFYHEGVFL
ncbi:hypothetical protein TNCV_310181 [Trichonephila clavipes]|nr:hypothetical protein TNCV_310181 [Trichonephila clavipes]